jgi:trimethylamine--corrinoid protein Co-methyltransferase
VKRRTSAGFSSWTGLGVQLFSDYELEMIHDATLEVLEKSGIFFESDLALDIFEKGGACVDRDTKIVKIPPYMVEESLLAAPHSVVLAGRNPENDIILERGRVYFSAFGVGIETKDLYTGHHRKTVKEDNYNVAKIIDALDDYDWCFESVTPNDCDPRTQMIHSYHGHMMGTTKHCTTSPDNQRMAQIIIDMAAEIVGGKDKLKDRPIIHGGGNTLGPLGFGKGISDTVIEYAQVGLPSLVVPMGLLGGTYPVTIASALVVHNSEALAGLCLAQLAKRGAPYIYGSTTTCMELSLATACVGIPEMGMIQAAVAKLAQMYNLPSFTAGT